MKKSFHFLLSVIIIIGITACGNSDEQWVEEHGYGPITDKLELSEIDSDLALQGKQIFDSYCAACHALNSQISGPALRRVVDKRTPEFVINYTLNPRENSENHPIGQELSEQYSAMMFDTGIDEEEAIAVYEYMRYYNEHRADPEE